jgi:hypothetical protein
MSSGVAEPHYDMTACSKIMKESCEFLVAMDVILLRFSTLNMARSYSVLRRADLR